MDARFPTQSHIHQIQTIMSIPALDWQVIEQHRLPNMDFQTNPATQENLVAYAMFHAPGAVSYLCKQGYDIHGRYGEGPWPTTALSIGFEWANTDAHLDALKALLAYSPNLEDEGSHIVLKATTPTLAKLLLDHQVSPNLQDKQGYLLWKYPIQSSKGWDAEDILVELLEAGLDPTQDAHLIDGFLMEVSQKLLSKPVADRLLSKFSVEQLNEDKISLDTSKFAMQILSRACSFSNWNMVEALLDKGVQVTRKDSFYNDYPLNLLLTSLPGELEMVESAHLDWFWDRIERLFSKFVEQGAEGFVALAEFYEVGKDYDLFQFQAIHDRLYALLEKRALTQSLATPIQPSTPSHRL